MAILGLTNAYGAHGPQQTYGQVYGQPQGKAVDASVSSLFWNILGVIVTIVIIVIVFLLFCASSSSAGFISQYFWDCFTCSKGPRRNHHHHE